LATSFRKGLQGVGMGASFALTALWVTSAAAAPDLTPPWDMSRGARADPSGVAPFVILAEGVARDRAVECLTNAIYYEAATEPREGQEAVAQVVLNRVRHPAFPKSVCGVVYQGVGGGHACQFTFACDGSTARRPVAWRWNVAQDVAENALAGHVAAVIGASTHYHTWWVHPYWPSLVETTRIGAHVFYRLAGESGSTAALRGQYSNDEPGAPAVVAYRLARTAGGAVAPATPTGAAAFSVWGLHIATVSAKKGVIVVKTPS
jgi:hypothetical protein